MKGVFIYKASTYQKHARGMALSAVQSGIKSRK